MIHAEIIKAAGAFLAIMNPFLILPLFLKITDGLTPAQQRSMAFKVVLYAELMCAIVIVAGSKIIGFFGVTLSQFQIAGGLILAQMGWAMVAGEPVTSHHGTQHEHKQLAKRQDQLVQDNDVDTSITNLAFFPLTFPMLVGPATIATVVIYSGGTGVLGLAELIGIVTCVLALLFVVLFFASDIGKIMSETMRTITIRLMGTVLLSIAVGMVLTGVSGSFPRLVTP